MKAALPASSENRKFDFRMWIDKVGPFLGLLCIVILFSVLKRKEFANFDNAQLILVQMAVVATAALGMTLIIVSGGIDLSVGSNIALCTVTTALVLAKTQSPILGLLAGILTGAACGLLSGTLVTQLKLSPFIVTLGLWGALRGIAKGLSNQQPVIAPTTWLNSLLDSSSRVIVFPIGVWLSIGLAILIAAVLRYTRFGRHIFAVGSNEQTARLCGIQVEWTKLRLYTLAGALTGVAGLLQFSYLTLGDPTTAAGKELDIIAAVVIGGASLSGGQGSIFGTLVGATIMACVANGCTKLELANWVQEIVTGVIIVGAVALDRFRHRAK